MPDKHEVTSSSLVSPMVFEMNSEGIEKIIWSSEKGSTEDAWELPDEEGRD